MRRTGTLLLLALAALLPCGPAFAAHFQSHGIAAPTDYPGAPKQQPPQDKAPYAMNYAQEAVETLGFRQGHMDVFSSRPPGRTSLVPRFSGGVGAQGAMLKLEWRP